MILTNSPSRADTYFVSESGAGSKDGKSYANRAPIADHNSGVGVFNNLDGDTVYLCGDVTSTLSPPDSGTKGAEVAYNGNCSTQDATGSDYVYRGAGNGVDVNKNFLIFSWLHISSGKQAIYIRPGVNNVQIRNSYITGTNEGIWINQSNNITIGGNAEYSNLIKDLGVNTAYEDIAISGTDANRAHSITISYNELTGDGSSKGTDGIMVDSADNDDIGQPGKEVIIEHNYIHDHYRENELDFKGGGYYIIRKNIIKGSPSTYSANEMQVHFQSGCDHIYMYGNVLCGHDKGGILIWDHTPGGHAVEHVYIWSNLIYDMDWMGINLDDDNQGLNNVYLWNLTVVDNARDPASKTDCGLKMNDALKSSGALQVYNSIFAYNRDNQTINAAMQLYTAGTNNFIFDYNLYYSNHGHTDMYYDGSLKVFSYWQATNKDIHGIEADPGFNNRASGDYTTKSNLTGTKSDVALRMWYPDADKGLVENSNINAQQCGKTPGGYAKCAKGLILADRDNYNNGIWGKGAFVYGTKGTAATKKNTLGEVRNLRIKN